MIYISGPGHGGNAMVANTYLEGSYSEVYPNITRDELGMKKLYNSPELKENMKKYNLEKIKNFDISVVEKQMTDIYKEVF